MYINTSKQKSALLPVLAYTGVLCVVAVLSTTYYELPLGAAIRFLLVFLGATTCTGRVILHFLGIDDDLDGADVIALSHTLGYAVTLVLYVVAFLLGCQQFMWPIFLLLSTASIVGCIVLYQRGTCIVAYDCSLGLVLLFTLVLLGVYSLTFMLPNYLPITQTNSYYLDNVFWVGNNVELMYSIPPDNFRNVLAPNIRYHYLSSVRMAMFQMVTGAPAFQACFAYSFFDLALLLASSATMVMRELSEGNEDGLPLWLAVLLLLFSTGAEDYTCMSFLSHLYVASFGFGESFAFMLAYLALAKRFWERGTVRPQEVLVSALVLALCMGNKGTLGFVCLVVTFVLCATSLFSSERRGFALQFGLAMLAAGLAVYFGILSEGIWRNVGEVSNVRSMLSFPTVQSAYQVVRSLPLPRALREGLFLALYAFVCHPILYGLALVALVQGVVQHEFDALDLALLVATACCLIILRLVHMKGFSQSYFYMATIPLLWAYVARRLLVPRWLKTSGAKLGLSVAAVVLSLTLCYQLWLPKLAAKSVLHLVGKEIPESLTPMGGYSDNVVSPAAYDALVWVRDNLPVDALYMADVYDTASRNTYYPGSMSQRHVIMQWNLYGYLGVDYSDDVPSVFEGSQEALGQCREVGIGYLMQLTSSEALETLFPGSLEVVYRQGGVSVYRLR